MIYEATAQYVIIDNKGNDKNVKSSFILTNEEMFSDVEKKVYDELEGSTGLDVIAIKRSKFTEVINTRTSDDERVFAAEIAQTFVDEDTEEEKVMVYKWALFARSYDEAYVRVVEYLKQGYTDMEIISIKKTNIVDVL